MHATSNAVLFIVGFLAGTIFMGWVAWGEIQKERDLVREELKFLIGYAHLRNLVSGGKNEDGDTGGKDPR